MIFSRWGWGRFLPARAGDGRGVASDLSRKPMRMTAVPYVTPLLLGEPYAAPRVRRPYPVWALPVRALASCGMPGSALRIAFGVALATPTLLAGPRLFDHDNLQNL